MAAVREHWPNSNIYLAMLSSTWRAWCRLWVDFRSSKLARPRYSRPRDSLFSRKLAQDRRQSNGHASEALVVELLGRVCREVVMRVAVEGGVGDHDRGEAVGTEGPVV